MIQETIKVKGALSIKLFGPDGKLKGEQNVPNLVVTTGKTFIAARMVGTPTAMSHMAIGSGTVDPVIGDTTLGTELGRVTLTSSGSTGAVVTYVASFGAGTGTGAVTEAGIFNASSAGTMLCRTEFAVVNKGADDFMTITWTVTVS
jgi:roadblock/LC7 domain-containing protein